MMPDFPEAVSNAIAAVMADIPKLAREETNKHANYKFASIDDFLDAVRPLCAKHKLAIVQDETSFTIVQTMDKYGKPSDWLQMGFAYTVATAGVSWGPVMRSIMVRADMGSQAFGTAQSYSLKQFMRSLFQISTGDGEDADSHEQSSIASAAAKPAFVDGPAKNKSALDRDITAYTVHIAALTNSDDLETYITEQSPLLSQYRRHYGPNSDYWNAIVDHNKAARARVAARAEMPADTEGPAITDAPYEWPETVQRLVKQMGDRDTGKALKTWWELDATAAIIATLDVPTLAYVQGAYRDRLAEIKAMDTVTS